jgi:hypothetical protein
MPLNERNVQPDVRIYLFRFLDIIKQSWNNNIFRNTRKPFFEKLWWQMIQIQ